MAKTELRYNSENMRMESVEVEAKASTSGADGSHTTFLVKGAQYARLLALAQEDGLDLSTPNKRGIAINSYVRNFVNDRLEERAKVKPVEGEE